MIDSHLIDLTGYFFNNFTVIMVIFALIICILLAPAFDFERANGFCLGVILFCCVGLTGLWGFVMHAFFPSLNGQFSSGTLSPCEFDVALAQLGLGLSGVLALWRDFEFRFAVILSASCFLWGTAAEQLYSHFIRHDPSAGNSGMLLYANLAIPAFLWLLVAFRSR